MNWMIVATEHAYVTSNELILGGEPYQMGISAEEIPIHLPHLNLAQVLMH